MTINQLLDGAERELAIRKAVFDRRVTTGRMKRDQADYLIECQRETVELLKVVSKLYRTTTEIYALLEDR